MKKNTSNTEEIDFVKNKLGVEKEFKKKYFGGLGKEPSSEGIAFGRINQDYVMRETIKTIAKDGYNKEEFYAFFAKELEKRKTTNMTIREGEIEWAKDNPDKIHSEDKEVYSPTRNINEIEEKTFEISLNKIKNWFNSNIELNNEKIR